MADRALETINQRILADAPALIREADDAYRNFIGDTCAHMLHDGIRLLLLAGPSGSGKTTSANMLADAVRRAGRSCHVLSLDNFYRNATDPHYPRNERGERDLESCEALDLPLVRSCLSQAVRGEALHVPLYDFKTGMRRTDETYDIPPSAQGIIIVEGLHALNPALTQGLPKAATRKLFISVSTNLTVGGVRVLSGRKLRFLRRLVRDHLYRAASATRTLSLWRGVLAGEDKYLYPYRSEADITMDTFHSYELGLLAPYAAQVLHADPSDDPYAAVVAHAVELAQSVDEDLVPQESLMREFIVGGIYEHLY